MPDATHRDREAKAHSGSRQPAYLQWDPKESEPALRLTQCDDCRSAQICAERQRRKVLAIHARRKADEWEGRLTSFPRWAREVMF